MADHIEKTERVLDLAASTKENTFAETHLDRHLLQHYEMLQDEYQMQMVDVVISKAYRHVLACRQHEVLDAMTNLGITPEGRMMSPQELWEKYNLLKVESLFLQDMVSFLDQVKAKLTEQIPGLITDEQNLKVEG